MGGVRRIEGLAVRHSPDIEKDDRAHTDILGVESPHNEAVGTQVRHLRQTKGITQHDLAQEAGLSVDHIGKIERGTTSPTVEALARIAGGLGVSVKSAARATIARAAFLQPLVSASRIVGWPCLAELRILTHGQ
ncbi:MAG TPA: XRE family transcriptional regulator [Candidatus Latescibacteria bacterium]|nr:XRE family transcriptional regulator [Candidatus Latescibacterota bacterium]